MSKIIMKRGFSPDWERYFPYSPEKDMVFGRIACGLCWPSDKPGVLLVVGQSLGFRPPFTLYVLGLALYKKHEDLIDRALEFKKEFKVEGFYCNLQNEDSLQFLSFRNQQARSRNEAELQVRKAPHSQNGRISYHIKAIRELLSKGRKLLIFGEFPQLVAAINELPATIDSNVSENSYPAVTALGYVVTELASNVVSPYDSRPKFAEMDYNPLAGPRGRPPRRSRWYSRGMQRQRFAIMEKSIEDLFTHNR